MDSGLCMDSVVLCGMGYVEVVFTQQCTCLGGGAVGQEWRSGQAWLGWREQGSSGLAWPPGAGGKRLHRLVLLDHLLPLQRASGPGIRGVGEGIWLHAGRQYFGGRLLCQEPALAWGTYGPFLALS